MRALQGDDTSVNVSVSDRLAIYLKAGSTKIAMLQNSPPP
jgi:hypothetical protein